MDMRKYIWNVGNVASGVIISQLIAALSLPLISRFYSPEHYGVFGQYNYFVLIGSLILTARYDTLLAVCRRDEQRNLLLKSALALSAVLVLGGGFIILAADGLIKFCSLSFLMVSLMGAFATSVFQLFTSWLIAMQRYTRLMRVRIGQAVAISIGQILCGVIPGIQSVGLAAGDILSRSLVLPSMASWRRADKVSPPRRRGIVPMLAILRHFRSQAVYMSLSALLSTATLLAPVMFFSRMYDTAISGLFFMAYRLSALPVSLLGRSMAQVFMGDLGRASPAELRVVFKRVAVLSLGVSLVVGGLVWAGGFVVDYFFSGSWQGIGGFLRTQSLVCIGQIFMLPLVQVLTILSKQRSMFLWEFVRCLAIHAGFIILWETRLSPVATASIYGAMMLLLYFGLFAVCYRKVYSPGKSSNEDGAEDHPAPMGTL